MLAMKNVRTAVSTLRALRLALATLIGYPPVLHGMLTRRLQS